MAQASSHTTTHNLAGFVSIIASYEHRVGHACRLVAAHIPSPPLSSPTCYRRIPHPRQRLRNGRAATEQLIQAFPSACVHAADAVQRRGESGPQTL